MRIYDACVLLLGILGATAVAAPEQPDKDVLAEYSRFGRDTSHMGLLEKRCYGHEAHCHNNPANCCKGLYCGGGTRCHDCKKKNDKCSSEKECCGLKCVPESCGPGCTLPAVCQ